MYTFYVKSIVFIGMTLVSLANAIGQDWQSPIDHDIRLSGTFCELRSNHFHHGIDIKSSKGVSGDPVYSIGEGYVHRLRVQAAGYGNSIYIKHPEGYVSVYGHLLDLVPSLDSLVKAYQVDQESFELDINCDSLKIKINKGEKIGRMGSTGYSFGPHLHFEIRDAHSEITINPLLFDFKIKDNIPPKLSQIRLDYLTDEGRKYGEQHESVRRSGSKSTISGDTVRVGAWRCGIALRTQDLMNSTPNKNGVYGIDIHVDSQLVYRFRGDSLHFSHSRAVNIMKDVVALKEKRERWYLAYNLPGSPLPGHILYTDELGFIQTFENKARRVQVSIQDIVGNTNNLEFFILRSHSMKEQSFPSYNYKLLFDEPNIIKLGNAELACPENTFYRNQYITLDQVLDKSDNKMSQVISLKGEAIPFHKACTLKIEPRAADSLSMDKAVMLSCSKNNYNLIGGSVVEGKMECLINSFGEYLMYRDVRPPKFEVMKFPSSLRNQQRIQLRIMDEFESKGRAREVQCNAHIDEEWIPMVHDVKTNTFTYQLRDLELGDHQFEITYWDHAGNKKSWQRKFVIQ